MATQISTSEGQSRAYARAPTCFETNTSDIVLKSSPRDG